MERNIPGLLFYEDHDENMRTPFMHTANDVRGLSLNDDALFLANARSAAATLLTLARPIAPPDAILFITRAPGDPETTLRLEWSDGLPPFNIHRRDLPWDLSDALYLYEPAVPVWTHIDASAPGDRLFYSVE